MNLEFKDAWSARLTSPVLQKVDLETFFFDVERKFNKEKRGSAVDVDIFANKASPDDEGELEHLEELVRVLPPPQWFNIHVATVVLRFTSFGARRRPSP